MSTEDSVPPSDTGRRRFVQRGALALLALAPGVQLLAFAEGPGGSHASSGGRADEATSIRYGMLVDTTRCATGCTACVSACSQYNGWKNEGRPTDPQWIRKVDVRNPDTGYAFSLPIMCQHCADAPCVDVCPTGASFQRADGIVLVDRHICIGCRYCMMACPYKARSFVHQPLDNQRPLSPRGQGTVEACTLCAPRIDAGKVPACVEACATQGGGALVFGNLHDPTSDISARLAAYPSVELRADLALDTGIRYQGL